MPLLPAVEDSYVIRIVTWRKVLALHTALANGCDGEPVMGDLPAPPSPSAPLPTRQGSGHEMGAAIPVALTLPEP